MNDKLVISKKKKEKGQYGYKVFSVRVKEETVESLNQISKKTNRSMTCCIVIKIISKYLWKHL